jgi:ArsR family transcriptional regulator
MNRRKGMPRGRSEKRELAPECKSARHEGRRRAPSVSAEALERAAGLFRAMGDPPRLRLLALLAQGEACVTELAEAENEGLSTISQRLRVLRAEDIVVRRRAGKHINYALSDQHVVDLIFNALAHASELPATKGISR